MITDHDASPSRTECTAFAKNRHLDTCKLPQFCGWPNQNRSSGTEIQLSKVTAYDAPLASALPA
ncbi:MAG: hypothetical protein WBQ31_03000, partial [Candidatus Acidiferrales bacterium]